MQTLTKLLGDCAIVKRSETFNVKKTATKALAEQLYAQLRNVPGITVTLSTPKPRYRQLNVQTIHKPYTLLV